MGKYHSFEELHQGLAAERSAEEEETTRLRQERFGELLAGKFDQVPSGNFSSTLEGIDSVSLTKPGTEQAQTLSVTLFFTSERGTLQKQTFSLFADGTVSGEISKTLGRLSRGQILDEVLRIVGEVQLDAVVQINGEILPPGQAAVGETKKARESAERQRPARLDLRRLHLMERQPDLLFYFVSRRQGFNGYRGFVFPWGIVLEHPTTENAAYFIDFGEMVTIPQERLHAPLSTRIPEPERWDILQSRWRPFESLSKGKAIQLGAEAVRHLPGDRWMEQMGAELAERRKKLQAA